MLSFFADLAGAVVIVVMALTGLARFGGQSWPGCVVLPFRPHLAALSLAALCIAILARAPAITPFFAGLLALINVYPLFAAPRFMVPSRHAEPTPGTEEAPPQLSVLWLDLDGARRGALADLFKQALAPSKAPDTPVDLLIVAGGDGLGEAAWREAAGETWQSIAAPANSAMATNPGQEAVSVRIFTRRGFMGQVESADHGLVTLCTVRQPGLVLTMIVAALARPFAPSAPARRQPMLDALARLAPAHGRYLVLSGLGQSPWEKSFHTLPGRRVGDPRRTATWLSVHPLVGACLDHAHLGAGLRPERLDLYRIAEAPHRALVLTTTARP